MTVDPIAMKRCYFVLAGLATLAAFQSVVFPKWPTASPLPQSELDSRLKSVDLTALRLASRPPTRTYDLASSTQLVWKLKNGEELTLMKASSREQANFQVAFLARAEPSLQIKKRKIMTTPFPFASGRQKNNRPILQTCMMIGSDGSRGIGVTGVQLIEAESPLPSPRMQRLYEVLALRPSSKKTCVLVTLKGSQHQTSINPLLLKNILQVIAPVLSSIEHESPQSSKS